MIASASELITPRDLVTHRSGLPRHDLLWYNASLSRRQIVDRLPYLEPSETFRSKFQYNNLMFLTAGYLVERLTGRSWEDAVRARIFTPLGMTGSNFSVNDSQKAADFATPYDERDDKVVAIPFRDISTIGPAGSINSNVARHGTLADRSNSQGKDRRQTGLERGRAGRYPHAAHDDGRARRAQGDHAGRVRTGLGSRRLSRPPPRASRRSNRRFHRRDDALSR